MRHNGPLRFLNAELNLLDPKSRHTITRATAKTAVGKLMTLRMPIIEGLLYVHSFTRISLFVFLCHVQVLDQASGCDIISPLGLPCRSLLGWALPAYCLWFARSPPTLTRSGVPKGWPMIVIQHLSHRKNDLVLLVCTCFPTRIYWTTFAGESGSVANFFFFENA